ncbi:MAG: glycosyltransferase [Polyangiaceae bacterium]
MIDVTFVVPCYNEAQRIDVARFAELARGTHLIFVDDGSKDDTRAVLEALAAKCDGAVEVISLEKNQGKAEAVRAGMRLATDRGDRVVGFADADLATPPQELLRVAKTIDDRHVKAVLGARVALIGTSIKRNPARHYLGRVFATFATFVVRAPFYDTQCGAKAFANGPALKAALAEPFLTRWIFDVELIGRLLTGSPDAAALTLADFVELPLQEWVDVTGSKLSFAMAARVWIDLGRVAKDLEIRRRRANRSLK